MAIFEMTASKVTKKIIRNEKLFILDVRNKAAFEDWKIEGKQFAYLNIPYFDLIDGVEGILDKLPKDQDILVVCAKEGSSIMVAEMLSKAGLNVAFLKGGMKAWSEHLEPIKVGDLTGGGELYQFVRIGKGCLSYMLISEGEAVIIDPTRMTTIFTAFAKSKQATIKHVLDTHLHADHISGGRILAQETGASYWLPPKDADDVMYPYNSLEDQEIIQIGTTNIEIQALYTPGHTIGSTSFIIDNSYLLTGDILFIDSIGRPDLAGKAEDWVADLRDSLYKKYQELSKHLIVLPAHFMIIEELNNDGTVAKTLDDLFQENHGLNVKDESTFHKIVTKNLPPQPNAYQDIRKTNMGKISPDIERQREMEIGPNRCAVR